MTLILPEVGAIIPVSIFVSVVFPAPLGPISPINSPSSKIKSKFLTADFSSYSRLQRLLILPDNPSGFTNLR